MKKVLLSLLVVLLLGGCFSQDNEVEEIPEEEVVTNYTFSKDGQRYALRIPFTQSRLRINHERRAIYKEDTFEITKQLQTMSSNYFPVDQYFISEGTVINETLYTNLLRYESDTNTNGLNPKANQEYETVGGRKVEQPVILIDLFEMNYYESNATDAKLSGISIALAINKSVTTQDGISDSLSEQDMITYSENAARKLVSIIRQLPNMSQVPIFIGLYSLEKADSNLSGGFVSSAYFKSTSGQFEQAKQQWMMIPSTAASRLFPEFMTEFEIVKRAVNDFIPEEQVGFVGKVRVINDEIHYLQLSVNLQGKTYLEVQGVIQYVKELMQQRFEQFEFEILCEIKAGKDIVGVIKQKGNDVTVIYW